MTNSLGLTQEIEKKLNKKYKALFPYNETHILGVKLNCPKCKSLIGVRSSDHEVMYRAGKPVSVTGYRCSNCGNQEPAWAILSKQDGSEVNLDQLLNPEPEPAPRVIDDKEEYEAELERQKRAREEAVKRKQETKTKPTKRDIEFSKAEAKAAEEAAESFEVSDASAAEIEAFRKTKDA